MGLFSNTHLNLFITFKNPAPVQHYPSANSPDITLLLKTTQTYFQSVVHA